MTPEPQGRLLTATMVYLAILSASCLLVLIAAAVLERMG